MCVINISKITKNYGEKRGVFDLSLQIQQGEIMGFLGPNGAGKTTTIRQLLGFIRPNQGRLEILGMDCFRQADEIASHLGYLPGEIAFLDSMSGWEFIRFVAKMKGMKDLGRAPELMERFSLKPQGKLKRMSKGMKQKIGIICAFMQDPEIYILDEPTSGLDPLMQKEFVSLLLEEKKRGKTIFMSSHIFEEIEKTCDRVAMIKDGKLISVETIENLKSNKRKQVELILADENAASLLYEDLEAYGRQNSGMTVVGRDGNHLTVVILGTMDDLVKLSSRYTVQDIQIHTQSLEEMFLNYYGGDKNE